MQGSRSMQCGMACLFTTPLLHLACLAGGMANAIRNSCRLLQPDTRGACYLVLIDSIININTTWHWQSDSSSLCLPSRPPHGDRQAGVASAGCMTSPVHSNA